MQKIHSALQQNNMVASIEHVKLGQVDWISFPKFSKHAPDIIHFSCSSINFRREKYYLNIFNQSVVLSI